MSKPKRVVFELIKRGVCMGLDEDPYALLDEVRAENHESTAPAKVALAWRKGLKPNVDGHLVLGQCVKASDLQRELVDLDYVILLNREVWDDPEFTRPKQLALLDHEMCHAERALDSEFQPVIDTKGRPVWRIRKHDIEEFQGIVERHGCYKRDLEKFAQALASRKKSPLFSGVDDAPAQSEMPPVSGALMGALDRMASTVRTGGLESITISTEGMDPVVIDKAAAERIHKAARKRTN